MFSTKRDEWDRNTQIFCPKQTASHCWCGVRGSSELRKYQISQSEILFDTVVSGKSHLEIRGFEKHIENGESDITNRRSNLIGKLVLVFFSTFWLFCWYMWIIKRYNGKVLTVNGFYDLKCIDTHLYHPIVPDTNHWERLCWLSSCFAIAIPMILGKVSAALSL